VHRHHRASPPAARDLRFVISVRKWRRCSNASRTTLQHRARRDRSQQRTGTQVSARSEPHGETRVEDVARALDAFTSNDAISAREIIKSDSEINDLYNHTFHRLIELMVTEPPLQLATRGCCLSPNISNASATT
jgi:phosphate uptake regulator